MSKFNLKIKRSQKSFLKYNDMKTLFSIILLGVTFLSHAQKTPKNELCFGYINAGYFFDSTSMELSRFVKGRNFSLSYSRIFDNRFLLNITYARTSYKYFNDPQPAFYEDNTITSRSFKILSGYFGYKISKWGLSANLKAGISYCIRGSKGGHITYFDDGGWREPRAFYYYYRDFGGMLGLTVSHPIFWKLFGEIDCGYARMVSKLKVDPNQLFLSYRIGFRF